VQVMELALQVVAHGNLNAISDGATGCAQAHAALIGAGYNVRINIASLQDPAPGQPMLEELRGFEGQASQIETQVQAILRGRGGMPF